ncbi:hypothetical protein [Bartonella rattimassiliensis]|uniref:DUF4282 domain-containing protein n=1 Tax=Bartonella rattimassiliensis 15908 TaxID=1094556 RepID=J0QPT0_9HYPH|nr:hypothetical protein [Bartonella rattimassiliensis]EJF87761.1 hypothetical protein MCY_00062 [Bartonella rattimassiliensis 15908]
MSSNEENIRFDQELRSFSLEETFLTSKNYKVIFCIAFVISILRTVLFVSILLGWKLIGWEMDVVTIPFLIVIILSMLLFGGVPIAFVIRIILTGLLKKEINQLDQAIKQQRKIACQ